MEKFALGDVVSCNWKDGYADATVCRVHADGTVDLFRPYTATADFSMAGGREGSSAVICYVGIEEIKNRTTVGLTLLKKGRDLR